MNKVELISSMSTKSGLAKKDCEKALKSLIDSIGEELQKGDKVQLVGWGTFEVRERSERKGKNPKTLEEITIPASRVPVFKAGKQLKEKIN